MPSEVTKILEFNQHRKSDKTPSIIYVDLKTLIKRIDVSESNFEKLSKIKRNKHFPCMMYAELKITRKSFVNP